MGFFALVVTVAASWYLAGLSWTVALVVYPAFALVGPSEWHAYHRRHTSRITVAVALAWLIQVAAGAVWLTFQPPGTGWYALATAASVAATIVITATVAVPAHTTLADAFDAATQRALQRAHRLRTIAWTMAALSSTAALFVRD